MKKACVLFLCAAGVAVAGYGMEFTVTAGFMRAEAFEAVEGYGGLGRGALFWTAGGSLDVLPRKRVGGFIRFIAAGGRAADGVSGRYFCAEIPFGVSVSFLPRLTGRFGGRLTFVNLSLESGEGGAFTARSARDWAYASAGGEADWHVSPRFTVYGGAYVAPYMACEGVERRGVREWRGKLGRGAGIYGEAGAGFRLTARLEARVCGYARAAIAVARGRAREYDAGGDAGGEAGAEARATFWGAGLALAARR